MLDCVVYCGFISNTFLPYTSGITYRLTSWMCKLVSLNKINSNLYNPIWKGYYFRNDGHKDDSDLKEKSTTYFKSRYSVVRHIWFFK